MVLEHIRLSNQAKDHLIRLKTKTGIKQWNILSRWAFCLSIAEPSIPPKADIPTDSNVEMSWRVFGGQHDGIYEALLKERCKRDGLGSSPEVLSDQFKLHLHRGIGYLYGDKSVNNIANLLKKITSNEG